MDCSTKVLVGTAHSCRRYAIRSSDDVRLYCNIYAVFVGAGNNIIFQQCINYLIDTYGPYAASAISANTILRSLLAAGLPLAAKPMFHNLGVGPAASLMGGIACLALPIPFVFMKYGRTLREKSKIAPTSSD